MKDVSNWKISPIYSLSIRKLATYPPGWIEIRNFESGSSWRLTPIYDTDHYGQNRVVAFKFNAVLKIVQNNFIYYEKFWDDLVNDNYENVLLLKLQPEDSKQPNGQAMILGSHGLLNDNLNINVEFEQSSDESPFAIIKISTILNKNIFDGTQPFFKPIPTISGILPDSPL